MNWIVAPFVVAGDASPQCDILCGIVVCPCECTTRCQKCYCYERWGLGKFEVPSTN
jgi:hypothetical protein